MRGGVRVARMALISAQELATRLADDGHVVVCDVRFYLADHDQGRREYQRVGPKEAVLTTYDAETYSTADCLTVIGWYRKALEMCGAEAPSVVEEECRARGGQVCRYRITWS